MSGTFQGQNSTLATPLSIVQRDANANSAINAMVENTTTVPSATGTTVLTAASSPIQILIGTQIQTFVLPDATTLFLNQSYKFINNSTGDITLQTNDTTLLTTISAGTVVEVFCTSISISAGVWAITPVASGGGGSGTPNPTANTLVERDANVNAAINAISEGVLTAVTSAGTLTLTAASAPLNIFTGSTTHNVVLPDATTLRVNQAYTFTNRSSGIITVRLSSTTPLFTVAANTETTVYCTSIGTPVGGWVTTLPLYGGTINSAPAFLNIASDIPLTSSNIGTTGTLSIYNSDTLSHVITLPTTPALVFTSTTVWGNTSTTFTIPPKCVLTIETYGTNSVAIISVQQPATKSISFSSSSTLTASQLPWNTTTLITSTSGTGVSITITAPSGYTFNQGGNTSNTIAIRGGCCALVYTGTTVSSLVVISNNSPVTVDSSIKAVGLSTSTYDLISGTDFSVSYPMSTTSSQLVLPINGLYRVTMTITVAQSATAGGQLVLSVAGTGTNPPYYVDNTGFVQTVGTTFYGAPNYSANARSITTTVNFMAYSGGSDSRLNFTLSMTAGTGTIVANSSFIAIDKIV